MTKEELYGIRIPAPDRDIERQIRQSWDSIAKPLDGMGCFEEITARIGAIRKSTDIDISAKAVLVFCADNGIVEENISQSGQEVTAIVAESMRKGKSSVCKMAESIGAQVKVIDIGINSERKADGIIDRKIAFGTNNFLKEPAMTETEALQALETGMEMVKCCKEEGYGIVALGEMGVGNTTTSSAVAAALLGCEADAVTGKGAGLNNEGLKRKRAVINAALEKYHLAGEKPFTVLSAVGGLDIAGLTGACIGGAVYGLPVVLDGVISAIAALTAQRLAPGVRDYLIPSHESREPAAKRIMEELKLRPVIQADMALGEGTGAVMMLALLDMALAVYRQHTSFRDIGMENYRRFL